MKTSATMRFLSGCLWVLAGARLSAAGPKLVVYVSNQAHVPGKALHRAMKRAEEILGDAGIVSRWTEVPHDQEAEALYIRILRGSSPLSKSPDAFGAALMTGTSEASIMAEVYYGSVREKAYTDDELDALLARVMVHEVAHLLGAKHAVRGIMRAQWKTDHLLSGIAEWSFPADEAVRLKAAVEARMRPLSATASMSDMVDIMSDIGR
jgi:hypothetical protein